MREFFTTLFETGSWPARWYCGEWTSSLGWLHILSDCFIFGAYVAIPVVLLYFMVKRDDMVFPRILWLFAAFIFVCGTTHLVEAIIFWEPIYRFAGFLKFLTAGVSWMTVFALVQIVPQILELPGLAAINQQLEKEISERRVAQEKVDQANKSLSLRNDEIQQFVYTVSHDLQSPLVTTRGFVGMLKEDLESGNLDELRASIARIDAASSRMEDLIGDLMQLSRAGDIRYELEQVDVEKLLNELKDGFEENGFAEKVNIESPMPSVVADRVRLTEVFDNLLTNAFKYGCPDDTSVVRVTSEVKDNETIFRVIDEGPGIPEEFHEKIFLPFERLQPDGEGTGIGLAIVKRIVGNFGGRIWVDTTQSPGTSIAFSIPAAQ